MTSFFFIVSGALSILLLFIRATGSLLFVQAVENDNATTANPVCNPLGYIVVLKDNVSTTPKAVSQEYESKGVNVTHIYESVLKGFNIKIPENLCNSILNGLKNDLRIAYFEPDNIASIR